MECTPVSPRRPLTPEEVVQVISKSWGEATNLRMVSLPDGKAVQLTRSLDIETNTMTYYAIPSGAGKPPIAVITVEIVDGERGNISPVPSSEIKLSKQEASKLIDKFEAAAPVPADLRTVSLPDGRDVQLTRSQDSQTHTTTYYAIPAEPGKPPVAVITVDGESGRISPVPSPELSLGKRDASKLVEKFEAAASESPNLGVFEGSLRREGASEQLIKMATLVSTEPGKLQDLANKANVLTKPAEEILAEHPEIIAKPSVPETVRQDVREYRIINTTQMAVTSTSSFLAKGDFSSYLTNVDNLVTGSRTYYDVALVHTAERDKVLSSDSKEYKTMLTALDKIAEAQRLETNSK